MLAYAGLDVSLNITPPHGTPSADANHSDKQGTTATGMLILSRYAL
jgi:hypothetical protein